LEIARSRKKQKTAARHGLRGDAEGCSVRPLPYAGIIRIRFKGSFRLAELSVVMTPLGLL